MDTGGGKDGMHLSLEFALLMARNEIEVYILRQYFTKAMMPLDRDCHREMQLSWTKLRMGFAAQTGFAVSTQFQALALVRQAWIHGTAKETVEKSWKHCGIYPWNPAEVVINQANSLFRARLREADDFAFQDATSKELLRVPNTMLERKMPCASCKAPLLIRHKHCPDCGAANANFNVDSHAVMKEGRRSGHKRLRPSEFDIGEFMKTNFAGLKSLKALTEEGEKILDGSSSSSSSSSSSDSDDEAMLPAPPPEAKKPEAKKPEAKKPEALLAAAEALLAAPPPDAKKQEASLAAPPPEAKKPEAKKPEALLEAPLPDAKKAKASLAAPSKYDPPTIIPSQLKTLAGQKKAWGSVLADVTDPKNKPAFLTWLPDYTKEHQPEIAKLFGPGTSKEAIMKSLLDKVSAKTPEQRQKWYTTKVAHMLDTLKAKSAIKAKKVGHIKVTHSKYLHMH